MTKNLSIPYKIQRNRLKKFHKRCKNFNISVLSSMESETFTNKYQREFQISILSLWILLTLNQLINGHYNSTLTYSKEPLKNQFLEKKIDAKILSINSKFCSINHCVEVCWKRISLFSHS